MKRDDGAGRRRLPEADIGDGAATAEDADPTLAPPRVGGDAVEDVGAAGDFEDVSPQRVGALSGDDDWRLRFVLGARGAAPGAAADDVAASGGGAELHAAALAGIIFFGGELGCACTSTVCCLLLLLLLVLGILVVSVVVLLEVQVGSWKVLNEA